MLSTQGPTTGHPFRSCLGMLAVYLALAICTFSAAAFIGACGPPTIDDLESQLSELKQEESELSSQWVALRADIDRAASKETKARLEAKLAEVDEAWSGCLGEMDAVTAEIRRLEEEERGAIPAWESR